MPVQMIRQRLAAVLARYLVFTRWLRRLGLFFRRIGNLLIFLEGQIKLIQALGAHTKSMPVLSRQLMFELLNQQSLRLDLIR
jgi:hypothetical protein